MKYMGSKLRVSKYIIPIMLDSYKGKNFYDLFCGGCNLIDKIPDTYNRYANDYNEATYLAMLMIRDHIEDIPTSKEEFTELDYKALKEQSKKEKTGMNSFAAFAYSYGAMEYSTFRKDTIGKRDYVAESYRAAVKQNKLIRDIVFTNLSYDEVVIKPQSLIYCDIPYKNTAAYKTGDFDHDKFWGWCRDKKQEGHTVFVSEYNAPKDFKCVWEKEVCSSLTKNTGSKKGVERLFTL